MSWVTIIWSMIASACLTLAALHLLVWCQRRTAWPELLFTMTSVGAAGYAGCELLIMLARTPAQFAAALRWVQLPTWVVIVSLVCFVRLYLRAGRPWLAWTVCALRSLALVLNFLVGQNLNYREVTALRRIPFLGESVSLGVGVANPLMLVGQASLVLFLIFTVDAALAVWRRGDRRQALMTGGSIVIFSLTGLVQAVLVLWRIVDMPLTEGIFFLGIVLAMGYEMSRDTVRAAALSDALLESEQRMKLAVAAAHLSLWEWGIVRNETRSPENGGSRTGFGPFEPIGFARFLESVHPDDREPTQRAVLHSLEVSGELEAEYRVVAPDGATRWVAARGHVERDARGEPLWLRGVSVDFTDRRRAELELAQHRSELAHLSRITTMSELSSSLAHELNQPLAIILLNAQAAQRLLAQDPPDVAETRDILADIVSEDERAGEVIRRLRAMLKPGQTQQKLLPVDETIREVLLIARSDLIGRGVTVHTALVGGAPPVMGDRIQLQQVFLSLVLNACEAMAGTPPAQRRLTITTAHRDGWVRVSFSDTGCGLPADPERIFQPFYTTKKEGLGLGLAICRSIATAHEGRLWAEANQVAGHTPAPTAPVGATLQLELPTAGEGAGTSQP